MIDFWYALVAYLPFEWAGSDGLMFMKNALLGVFLIMPIFGLAGTMIVHHRMAFFSDALGHGAFTGVAAGAIAGLMFPEISALLFALIFAMAMVWVQRRSGLSRDSVLGALASFFVALGLFIATWGGKNSSLLNQFLLGDLLSVTPRDLYVALVVGVLFIVLWFVLFNRMLLLGAAPSIAISRSIKPVQLELIFACILAVLVALSIQWFGLLTVNACLILPASAARLFAKNTRRHVWISIVFALLAGIAGLLTSWYAGTVSGASMVLYLSAFFFVGLLVRKVN